LLYTRSNSTDYNALQLPYAKFLSGILISTCRDATTAEIDELRKPDNKPEPAGGGVGEHIYPEKDKQQARKP
jgi:hypothetical protein